MAELYILSQDDQLLTTITEETGLVSAKVREELNQVASEPFIFTVDADIPEAAHVAKENHVVFRDKEGDLRLYVIKELDDLDNLNGPQTTALCLPVCIDELSNHVVVDRRFVNQSAQTALDASVQGTRWTAIVEGEFGDATTNFYYISSVDAVWKTRNVWGGDIKDVVIFDEQNNIVERQVKLMQRLGADRGKRFEIDHDIEEIQRTILSYPKTALYGRGSSLPIEDDEGNETGGHTRLISFADVEWSVANGDPVDKPLGQRWVGDPDALQKYGYNHNSGRLHRFGIVQNGNIEDPLELLKWTWEQMKDAQNPEVNYRMSAQMLEHIAGYEHEKASLGDTVRAIDRDFARPIEVQARVIAIEYDLLDIEGTAVVEIGQFLSVDQYDDRLDRVEENLNNIGNRPNRVTEGSYPDTKPITPQNVEAYGGIDVIQLAWEWQNALYIQHYEVYGSQVESFIPSAENLLWRGDVSGFNHQVGTDQLWYYYVRAVNYHGTASDFSQQVSAATHRVMTDDILFGPELAERMRELHEQADIIGENGIDFDQIRQEVFDQIQADAKQYTDEEILHTENMLMQELADKAGLSYVDGRFSFLEDDLDGLQSNISQINSDLLDVSDNLSTVASNLTQRIADNEDLLDEQGGIITSIVYEVDTVKGTLDLTIDQLSSIDGQLQSQQTQINANAQEIVLKASQDDLDTLTGNVSSLSADLTVQAGLINAKAEQTQVNNLEDDITQVTSDMASLSIAVDGISTNVTSLQAEFDGMEISGRNIVKNSNPIESLEGWEPVNSRAIVTLAINRDPFDSYPSGILLRKNGDATASVAVYSPSFKLIAGRTYTVSFVVGSDTFRTNLDFTRVFNRETGSVMGVLDIGNFEQKYKYYDNFRTSASNWRTYRVVETFIASVDTDEACIRIGFMPDRDGPEGVYVGFLKVEEGTRDTGWSHAPEDTDYAISNVEQFASSIDQKADSILMTVNNLSQVMDGHSSSITDINTSLGVLNGAINAKAEQTQVDSIAGQITSVSSQVAQLNIDVSGISTSVSDLRFYSDNFDGSGPNLLPYSSVDYIGRWQSWHPDAGDISTATRILNGKNRLVFTMTQNATAVDGRFTMISHTSNPNHRFALVEGSFYTISFAIQTGAAADVMNRIGIASTDYSTHYPITPLNEGLRVRNVTNGFVKVNDDVFYKVSPAYVDGISEISWNKVQITFRAPWSSEGCRLLIGRRVENANFTSNWFRITDMQVQQGTIVTEWQPTQEEREARITSAETSITQLSSEITFKASQTSVNSLTNRMSQAESELSVQADQILARVEKDGIVSSINLSPEGLRIDGALIEITGTTLIHNGVIKSAHIESLAVGTGAIANLAVTNAKIGNLAVNTAQIASLAVTAAKIANATITNAKIADATITSAKIASLDVDKLTGNISSFIQTTWNNVSSQVSITGSGLETFSGGVRTSLLDGSAHRFYRNNNHVGNIGTSTWVGNPNYRGLTFQMTNACNYMAWSHQETSGGNFITKLAWHRNNDVTDAGFSIDDHIRVGSSYNMYVRTLSTTNYSNGNRHVQLNNFTWNGMDGVTFVRGGNANGSKLFLGDNTATLMSNGNAYIQVSQDGTGNYVQSMDVYTRTYTATTQMLRVTQNGVLGRSTSSRRYKLCEEPVSLDYAKRILSVDAKTWYDKRAVEEYAEELSTGEKFEQQDIRRIPGLIAEDMHDAGLELLVNYDEQNRPDGISSNAWVLHTPLIKDLYEEMNWLKMKNQYLEMKIKQIEEKIA